MKNLLRIMIGICIFSLICGNDECSPPTILNVTNNYPGCLSTENRDYGIEYEYMVGTPGIFDATTEMYRVHDAYRNAKVNINNVYSTAVAYEELDCEGDTEIRNEMLDDFTNANFTYTTQTGIHGYAVGIDRVLNDPNPDIGGICRRDGGYNAVYIYVGLCHEISPTNSANYSAGILAHELVHQILQTGHDGHGFNNETCCIIQGSYPNGFCAISNVVLCDNHRCSINTAEWPRW